MSFMLDAILWRGIFGKKSVLLSILTKSFKVKFDTYIDLNVKNSMVVFIATVLDWNLVRKRSILFMTDAFLKVKSACWS